MAINQTRVFRPPQVTRIIGVVESARQTGSSVTLSNSNTTMQCSSGTNCRVRGTTSHSTGKYYIEFVADSITAGTNTPMVGLLVGSATLNAPTWGGSGGSDNGYGALPAPTMFIRAPTTGSDPGVGFSAADVFGVAIDFTGGKIWFSRRATPTCCRATRRPAPTRISLGLSGTYFPAAYANGGQVTGHFIASTLTYAKPTGFLAWDGS